MRLANFYDNFSYIFSKYRPFNVKLDILKEKLNFSQTIRHLSQSIAFCIDI